MAPQTPLLLVDNLFDTTQLYPNGVLTASSERVGHEAYRVAGYRRERNSWQTATTAAGHSVQVDLGATTTRAVDSLFIDRGHNLWGKTLTLKFSTTGTAPWTSQLSLNVPAQGTLGGDPTSSTMSVTEEGALWSLFALTSAKRAWQVAVVDNMAPVIPGLILGLRYQLRGYSTSFDEDAGDRTETSAVSTAGYKGVDTTYSWRTCDIGLVLIGATDYDTSIRALREIIFKRNQPWVCFMDWGTRPERGWMFQLEGKSWTMAKKRVYREGRIRGREVGASLS